MTKKIFLHDKKNGSIDLPSDLSQTREFSLKRQVYTSISIEYVNEKAWEKFHALPIHVLPLLPERYQWIKEDDEYHIIRDSYSEKRELTLVLYGPDTKHQYINFIFLVDNVTWYSFAHTKNGSGPEDRHYPPEINFKVLDYDYSKKGIKVM